MSFPINSMVIFHSYVSHYQRVTTPVILDKGSSVTPVCLVGVELAPDTDSLPSKRRSNWFPHCCEDAWRMVYPLVNSHILPWKITMLLMGKSTISMAIFNCYVSSPEGNLMVILLLHLAISTRITIGDSVM